jgi:stress response protein SCP2
MANSYNINSYSSKQNNPISEFDLKISGFTIKENDKISAANNSLFFQDKSTKLINFKTIEINFYKKFDMKKLYSTIKIDSTISFDIAGFGYVAFNDAKNIFSQYDVSVDASDTAAALPLACFGEIHTKDLNSTEEDPEDGKISKDSENFKITISTVGDEVKTLGVSALALLISPNTIGNSLTNFSG